MAGLEKQRVESKFFDLDDIIAKSESTGCTFEIGELNPDFFQEMLGFAKPTQNSEGYGAETPLWLLESVRTPFTIHPPKVYTATMQGVLNADARFINLYREQQHFYTNGMNLCHLMKEENPDGALNLARCILQVLTQRLGGIVSQAAHRRAGTEKFDVLEQKVFQEAKRFKEDTDRWLKQERKGTSKKRKLDN